MNDDTTRPDGGVQTEPELKRGPFQRWINRSIDDPERAYRAMFYVATGFFLVTTLFPFYFLLVLAVTPEAAGLQLVPAAFDFGVFLDVFRQINFLRYMFNSLVLALTTTAIVLLLSSLAGYVFGRLEFPGRTPLMLLVLAISYFPPAAFFVPLYQLFTGNVIQGLVLYNTPGAMILPFSSLFMPLSIFILTTFYGQIPDGLEDAARVEGTTRLGALFRVIVPLSAPGVATAGVLTFIAVYNEFFFSQLMNNGQPENWAPIVGGLLQLQRAGQFQVTYGIMAAGSIIAVVPVAILVVVAQEKIVSGLTAGALKE
ncbi:carbohydrate ABC transporter permease [Halobaculum gomorrense]|uniref:Carbohydrate ABC transporter membrane protein 2, CUT1 family n=1 Tax=Halobaculum gomorrense TaxID=43928 RepID=A0A1M5SHP2_9EURY|nr:carbohydrate ABC transporter permease [Halobaculum gomorrense]SHH38056.1 carbohydrate ABC transporter membrane protein 2, CUT1 family [Halobaculum gomorrense]